MVNVYLPYHGEPPEEVAGDLNCSDAQPIIDTGFTPWSCIVNLSNLYYQLNDPIYEDINFDEVSDTELGVYLSR